MTDDRDFDAFPESKYAHKGTLGLGNYRGKPFVTGCSATTCYQKTEILDRSIHRYNSLRFGNSRMRFASGMKLLY